jgi:hypothetical protein
MSQSNPFSVFKILDKAASDVASEQSGLAPTCTLEPEVLQADNKNASVEIRVPLYPNSYKVLYTAYSPQTLVNASASAREHIKPLDTPNAAGATYVLTFCHWNIDVAITHVLDWIASLPPGKKQPQFPFTRVPDVKNDFSMRSPALPRWGEYIAYLRAEKVLRGKDLATGLILIARNSQKPQQNRKWYLSDRDFRAVADTLAEARMGAWSGFKKHDFTKHKELVVVPRPLHLGTSASVGICWG